MNLVDVLRARRRIAPYVRRTPLVRSLWLSDLSGGDLGPVGDRVQFEAQMELARFLLDRQLREQ